MKLRQLLILLLLAGLGAFLFVGCTVWRQYDRAVTLDEQVKNAWAQVESQMQRRLDLIPNVVETVKGVADQEVKVFQGIADARKSYFQADTTAAKAKAASGVESALSRLLMLRETYPELKSNEAFLNLQATLEGTENRIGVERKRYNDAVTALNSFRRRLLGKIGAALAGVDAAEYFEAAEGAETPPKVDFSGRGQTSEGG